MRSDVRLPWRGGVIAASGSNRGAGHEINEDAVGAVPARRLWLVADGMGGHAAGEVASALVRDTLIAHGDEALPAAMIAAHRAVVAAAERDEARHGMGSTVVAVRVRGACAEIGWVGDSRIYRLRGAALERLTRDHSFVEALLERGEISVDEARSHPNRNVIVQSLGSGEPHPDEREVPLEDGDWLLLCSDGLSDELDDDEIAAAVKGAADPEAAVTALLAAAREREARDDVSVVVLRYAAPLLDETMRAVAGGVLGALGAGLGAGLIWWFTND